MGEIMALTQILVPRLLLIPPLLNRWRFPPWVDTTGDILVLGMLGFVLQLSLLVGGQERN